MTTARTLRNWLQDHSRPTGARIKRRAAIRKWWARLPRIIGASLAVAAVVIAWLAQSHYERELQAASAREDALARMVLAMQDQRTSEPIRVTVRPPLSAAERRMSDSVASLSGARKGAK